MAWKWSLFCDKEKVKGENKQHSFLFLSSTYMAILLRNIIQNQNKI